MEMIKPMKKVKLIDSIEHQGIGGKVIILERKMTLAEAPMNIALINYTKRKPFTINIDQPIYYGHVNGLGYFVSEDEFDGELEEATLDDFKEIW